jgi:UDP-N-acetylmuramate-alanine ligase
MQKEKICDLLDTFIKPGDLLMFLGAGDIGKVSGEFIKRLKAKKEDALTF